MMDTINVLEESSSSTAYGGAGGGGRAIDRHNPIIRDEKRLAQGRIFPLTASNVTHHRQVAAGAGDRKKKSVAFAGGGDDDDDHEFINPGDFFSPATSSRCLLSEKATFSFSSEFDSDPPPPPPREQLMSHNKKDDDLLTSPPPTPSPPPTEDLRFFNSDDDDDDDSLSYSPPKPPPPPPEPLEFYNYKASNEKHVESPYYATRKPPSPPPPPPEPLELYNYKISNKKHQDSLYFPTCKPPSPPPPPSSNQVVVLEVSLHCRGCERKMRKHISKIQGVKSFKIEFAAKKVTVVGDVTPLAVLTSVLKVKNAKLLTPAAISTSSSPAEPNH